MARPETREFAVQHEHARWEHVDGKYTKIVDKVTTERIIVAVDWENIAKKLGARAVSNKTGRTVEISGMVEVNHIRTGSTK